MGAFGFRYADRHRAPIVAVNVSDDRRGDVWVDDRMLETHLVQADPALALLDGEVEPWRLAYPRLVVRRAVFDGPTAAGLLRAAACARLLVMGSHGHGRLYHAVVGSVAEECIRAAVCPVAVIPPSHAGGAATSVHGGPATKGALP